MAQQFDALLERHSDFIAAQHMFFVGTAAADGRVNISPKGLDSLRVLGPNRVVWLNATGSGNESAAHVLANPRMTLMFCAFEGKPLILRLYGTARTIQPVDADWDELSGLFPPILGARQVFDLDIDLVQTSCGFAVPLYSYESQRDVLDSWSAKKGPDGIATYQQEHNRTSIDGFPTGLPPRTAQPESLDA